MRKSQSSGYTLVETIVATLILVLAMMSVLGVCAHCMRSITAFRRMARSSQLLQQKMEDIRLITVWSNLTTLANTTFTDPANPNIYAGSITESNWDTYGGTTNVILVTLTVSWTNQTYRPVTNSLSTLICIGGLNKYIF